MFRGTCCMWRNEGIKMYDKPESAGNRCLFEVHLHGSNPKEELLGIFCISDSGQALRSIKQHVSHKYTEVLWCNC